jgi:hypothetical protein
MHNERKLKKFSEPNVNAIGLRFFNIAWNFSLPE